MDAIPTGDLSEIRSRLLDLKAGFVSLLRVQRRLTANMLPACLGSSHPGASSLADQRALELGHGSQQVEQQPSSRRRRVDGLAQRVEFDLTRSKLADEPDKFHERASQAIEAPDDQHDRLRRALVFQWLSRTRIASIAL